MTLLTIISSIHFICPMIFLIQLRPEHKKAGSVKVVKLLTNHNQKTTTRVFVHLVLKQTLKGTIKDEEPNKTVLASMLFLLKLNKLMNHCLMTISNSYSSLLFLRLYQ